MNKLKTIADFGSDVRIKVKGAPRVKITPEKKPAASVVITAPKPEPYPEMPWDDLRDVLSHLSVVDQNPDNWFTDINNIRHNTISDGDPVGTVVDAAFAHNELLSERAQADPKGFARAVKFRAGTPDRRPIYKDGTLFFDNVDDYLLAENLKLTFDMELFAVVEMQEGTSGCLWGSTGFGYAAPFLDGSDSRVFGNPAPIRYEINGIEVVSSGDAYLRAVGNKALIKVRLNLANEVIWPDLIFGGKNRIEWFINTKVYGFAIFDRFTAGRSLTIPERRALFKIIGA
jgi:hypothetical protein